MNKTFFKSVLAVGALVVGLRELFLYFFSQLGYPEAANLAAMLFLLVVLVCFRLKNALPGWLSVGSNALLTESALAYLPVCAGGGLLLFAAFGELGGVLLVTCVATLGSLALLGFLCAKVMRAAP